MGWGGKKKEEPIDKKCHSLRQWQFNCNQSTIPPTYKNNCKKNIFFLLSVGKWTIEDYMNGAGGDD